MRPEETTEETEALDERTADVLVAHADGSLTSADYADIIALACAHGFRPRYLRAASRMTEAQRARPTLPVPSRQQKFERGLTAGRAPADMAERRAALTAQAHGEDVAVDVDWEDGA